MDSMKPVVRFVGNARFHDHSDSIRSAVVYALDHPRLGENKVYTSQVLSGDGDEFETLNTIYRRVYDYQ